MAEPTPLKSTRKVHPNRFRSAEGVRNIWNVVPENGTAFKDLLDSGYWAHIAERLRPNDRIEVDAEDGSYTALLVVRSTSRLAAQVAVVWKHDFDPLQAQPASEEFKVVWKGPMHKHAIVRAGDEKIMLHGGFDTKEAAFAWLGLNAKTLAA